LFNVVFRSIDLVLSVGIQHLAFVAILSANTLHLLQSYTIPICLSVHKSIILIYQTII